ncbi:MAG: 2Fe-2S iron-sulfur cluster-binding protein, partial [Ilumatobacteraceae bacterium]
MTATESGTEPVAAPVDPNEVRVTINGREVVSKKGELVIAAAQRAGDYIPRFCYHERMSSVAMCRMCLVDIDTGRGPALQPSCLVTVAPG